MNKPSIIISRADSSIALGYLAGHLADSRIVQYLGRDTLTSECETISIVTSSPHPGGARLDSGFGGQAAPCTAWLIQEAISYLQRTSDGVVLFEDLNSLPTDPYLTKRDHPFFWHYGDRLFWPVTALAADSRAVEQAKNWAGAMREVACFSKVPHNLNSVFETRSLTQDEFGFIASSLRAVVTDVFDGEGYIEWNRRQFKRFGVSDGKDSRPF
jgi:hypothetical protein